MNDRELMEAAGKELAERMMEDVRSKARRDFTAHMHRQMSYAADFTEGPDKPKYEFVRDYLKSILDNEANWRTL